MKNSWIRITIMMVATVAGCTSGDDEPTSGDLRLRPGVEDANHRGELVNLARVRAVRAEAGNHLAELDDGQVARISRRVFTAFKAALGG
jgi:hypothetical protein